jgi:hypothetical protein
MMAQNVRPGPGPDTGLGAGVLKLALVHNTDVCSSQGALSVLELLQHAAIKSHLIPYPHPQNTRFSGLGMSLCVIQRW